MKIVLDIKKGEAKSKKRFFLELLGFAMATLTVGAIVTLSILLSPEEYLLMGVLLIVLVTAYAWASLYFFGVTFRNAKEEKAFYVSACQGKREKEKLTFLSMSETCSASKDGLPAYTLSASFAKGDKTYERSLYVLGVKPELQEGQTFVAESYANVLLSYEVLYEK